MFKKDFFLAGVLTGAILPVILSVLINLVNIWILGKPNFDILSSKPAMMGCLLLNVVMFRVLMMNLKKYAMAKGLLLATLLFAFLILIK